METGPPAVWLWNALAAKGLPMVVLDARHAGAALTMRPDRTDRHDARGLARNVGPGWDKEVRIKSHGASVIRALLTARDAPVGIRVRLENAIRGLLRTFGVLFDRRVGGVMRRAEGIIAEELAIAPELRPVFDAPVAARRAILERIRMLDARLRAVARKSRVVRLFMTAPGSGPTTALAVATAFDDAARLPRPSCAGAYAGLTPKRYDAGGISQDGRIARRGDRMTRTCLYEAAKALMTRNIGGSGRRDRVLAGAKRTGPRKAKVALARKLAVMLHAPSCSTRCGGPGNRSKSGSPRDAHERPDEVRLTAPASTGCVQPGRRARTRSLPGLRPLRPPALTPSIRPIPTANMPRPCGDRGETPGTRHASLRRAHHHTTPLSTRAIREPPGTRSAAGRAQADGRHR